ncbi:type II secretion system protein [Blastopirellula marina]|uniref:Redox-sensing transcriptional repressor Rex n=1 Tax=Blastopirellula marina TaxID=124 RepID=A0A2S8GAP0_9BACT|nr:prepilin-type N-terminal cleavage/methylation domain-containing protein [Blastopirellula marina]PQO26837.1 redox-sensing transcriptional repressor Rex [Blastopirellula marina]PQO41525.1 redox-sensing transcriptional repressor Rex [Blastopirellula marina]PTL41044.1 prepilin-type N-terminal cleavage/methylation domain-containing protein [Blastopirellula marina]
MSNKKHAGFTLIEVLIVVVILAVLAATVIPQFTDSTDDAKASSVKFNLHTLRSQIQLYRAQHEGALPSATLNELLIKTNDDGTSTGTPTLGPYLSKLPVNSYTNSATVKTISAVPTSSDVTDTHGWLYNTTNGNIYINHEDMLTE